MDKSKLKAYAPAARREFIKAVTERANFFGLSQKHIEPLEVNGDIALIGGRAFSKDIAPQREELEKKIQQKGFDQFIEAVAYTWFNRLVALRYMEVHGYLEHGYRVLSHPNGGHIPEILEYSATVELTGLDRKKVVELKLDGTKDNELYRMLLIAQCNELNRAMPFLYERIQEETELLLPENLLHSNSLIQKLVTEIPEEDWQEVEIIGWLYQFYISERKDEVFEGLKKNKKINPENIPAATQLFTPNWIVRYLVENTLGRLWMLNRPGSKLIEQMSYYIKPEQPETDFLRINTPEEIKISDPACGSGHMLTYAFDLLHSIYEEEGYEPAEIPQKILNHNLYGVEIDARAGELAAFALTMKARARQKCFFRKPIQPNICVLERIQFEEKELNDYMDFMGRDLFTTPLQATLYQFEEADNFGSLTRPEATDVEDILHTLEAKDLAGQLYLSETHKKVFQALKQADYLSPKYAALVTNPPYMAGKGMNVSLKEFLGDKYPQGKADLMACFMERANSLIMDGGFWGMINLPSWMFLQSFHELRANLLKSVKIDSLLHLGRGIFGADFGSVAFVIYRPTSAEKKKEILKKGIYRRLFDKPSMVRNPDEIRVLFKNYSLGVYKVSQIRFIEIPGMPVTYWIASHVYNLFKNDMMQNYLKVCAGLTTGNTERFLRYWHEVVANKIMLDIDLIPNQSSFIPYDKGGIFRKWYGNLEYVLWYYSDSLKEMEKQKGFRPDGLISFFKPSITWSKVTISLFSARYSTKQNGFDATSSSAFGEIEDIQKALLVLNSRLGNYFLNILNSTMVYLPRDIKHFPVVRSLWQSNIDFKTKFNQLVSISKNDWDSYETSWDFTSFPLLNPDQQQPTLKVTYQKVCAHWGEMTLEMQQLEEENNRIFIDAYGLQDELTPEVPISEITLTCNPHYRYGGDKSDDKLEAQLLTDTIKELLSYALGCMMGRYSLGQPGLVYAHSGNEEFDHSKYEVLPADDDGIVPVMGLDWFPDDASVRFVEFLKVAWSPETLEENLQFVADSLSPKRGEAARETIRRYFSVQFYKDHLKTYKKRPIYWLFSSGKEKAFQCLVYLHRYNDSTLSRMRNEYVIPLQGKFSSRAEHLDKELKAAEATSQRNKIQKQLDILKKKQLELTRFDEELRHYADKRITLDLDDGVKVNYGKFGNLLAEVKAVTGKKE